MTSSKLPIGIVAAGAIIAVAIYLSAPNVRQASHLELLRPISTQDHVLGNPAAPVMIIAYLDPSCSVCSVAYDTLRQLIANDGARGRVALAYRYFPGTETSSARAQECASSAGSTAFWSFTDALYQDQHVDDSAFGSIANALKLPGSFASCYANSESGAVTARITQDRDNAVALGATEAPIVLVVPEGGVPQILDPLLSYDDLRTAVSAALQTSASTNPSR